MTAAVLAGLGLGWELARGAWLWLVAGGLTPVDSLGRRSTRSTERDLKRG